VPLNAYCAKNDANEDFKVHHGDTLRSVEFAKISATSERSKIIMSRNQKMSIEISCRRDDNLRDKAGKNCKIWKINVFSGYLDGLENVAARAEHRHEEV